MGDKLTGCHWIYRKNKYTEITSPQRPLHLKTLETGRASARALFLYSSMDTWLRYLLAYCGSWGGDRGECWQSLLPQKPTTLHQFRTSDTKARNKRMCYTPLCCWLKPFRMLYAMKFNLSSLFEINTEVDMHLNSIQLILKYIQPKSQSKTGIFIIKCIEKIWSESHLQCILEVQIEKALKSMLK